MAYWCANDCNPEEYTNCTVQFINPYDGEWVYDWSCDEFESTFVNDTDDEDECEYFEHNLSCADFSFAESECHIYVNYSDCSAETGNWTCEVASIDETTGQNVYEDCTSDFEEYEFWQMMRNESFWESNWDEYSQFFEFWEQYHADGNSTDVCDVCEYHDCTDEVDGLQWCSATVCYDSCTDYSSCEVNFYADYYGQEQTWDCDSFEEYFFGHNDTNSTNDTKCEDVYIDLTCGNFTMLADNECWIYGMYNRCNDQNWTCSVTGYNESGYYYDDCSAEFEDSEFWAAMREEQFWFDNWDMYYDFYEHWEQYHSGNNTDNDTECTQECYEPYDCSEQFDLGYCMAEECWNSCDYEEGWCNIHFTYEGVDNSMECMAFYDFINGNDTDNETECEDVYIDLTCGNFTMLNDSECWIYGMYNRCNDQNWTCSVTGYNESGYYYDDCSASFEDVFFWEQMREEQFWFDNWDMYYDFYEHWDQYHAGPSNDTDNDTDCDWKYIELDC
jgi:hypothetical protein